jgi:hypothetical protein
MTVNGNVTRISNTEYVSGVYGSTNYASADYAVNAGLTVDQTGKGLFSWLFHIAGRYENYKFTKLVLRYEPACSTTAIGQVGMFLDYGVDGAAPETWNTAAVSYGFVASSPWLPNALHLEPARVNPSKKFVRSDLTTGMDLKIMDAARLYVVTNGQADATLVGYLYVDYVVELYTPEPSPTAATTVQSIGGTYQALGNTLTSTVERSLDFDSAQKIESQGTRTVSSDFISITGTVGRFVLARGLWIVRVVTYLKNSLAATTALALALKKYTPTAIGSHVEINAALDATGSGAHATIAGPRFSLHSTVDTSIGDAPVTGEWTVYSDGITAYGVYGTATFASGAVTTETAGRLHLEPVQ